MHLSGKKILLGITGGIAAYKSVELLRLLQKQGAEVRVAMTPAATKFVGSLTFASLSGCPVYLQDGVPETRPFSHIDFPRWADLFIVAPCTANTLGKFAGGIADDPVSLCFMTSLGEKWIVPAMNTAMYLSPAVQKNRERLRSFPGVHFVEAASGKLACGESGIGRFPEPEEIVQALLAAADPQTAEPNGKRILITGGRTEEAIDPVRYISNRSSGKTATALARAFRDAGYLVTLVHGPMEAEIPDSIVSVFTRSAREMHTEVLARFPESDAVIHCAAVADYRPKTAAGEKIKDSRSALTLELEANPHILRDTAANKKAGQVVVGFALETETPEKHALEKLKTSGADLIVLNTPVETSGGFGEDSVSFALLAAGENAPPLHFGKKSELAGEIVTFVNRKLGVKNV